MAYVLEMVSRRGSLLKIIMIITYLQYSSRRSLMIEEEVEGMTCDLMAIAGRGGVGRRSTLFIHDEWKSST